MTSVFVASQTSCFFLCSREQIRQVENRLKGQAVRVSVTIKALFHSSQNPHIASSLREFLRALAASLRVDMKQDMNM